jgi:hypothetical protein
MGSYKKYLIAALALPALLFFQNCSEVAFNTMNGGELVALSDNQTVVDLDDDSMNIVPPTTPVVTVPPTAPTTPVVTTPPTAPTTPVVTAPPTAPTPNVNYSEEESSEEVVAEEGDDNALNYVCILEGPGKSVKLHFEQTLSSGISTINAVCTTKSACLNIVSQKFAVKSAERRGFCGKNQHTVTLTGAQLMNLIQ